MKFNTNAMKYKTIIGRDDGKYYDIVRGQFIESTCPVLFPSNITMTDIRAINNISQSVASQFKLIRLEVIRLDNDEYLENRYISVDWPDYQMYMEHPDWQDKVVIDTNTERNVNTVLIPLYIINAIDKKLE